MANLMKIKDAKSWAKSLKPIHKIMAAGLHSPTTTKSKGDIKIMVNFVSVAEGMTSVGKGIGFGIIAIGALPFLLLKSLQ